MAEKLLSFEEYFTKTKAPAVEETEETEDAPLENEDELEDEEESEEDESEEEDAEESEEDEDEEESEESEEEEAGEKSVAEMLKECYKNVVSEACAYENDEYPEHTLEAYLKENASMCAALGADALERAHESVREGEMTQEIFEAACNEMKEAFMKKIDEVKEAWAAK